MALFFECMQECAQKVLDAADIVRDGDFSPTIQANNRGPWLRLCLLAAKSTRQNTRLCFLPYRFNELPGDAEGPSSAIVKPSEPLLLFQVP